MDFAVIRKCAHEAPRSVVRGVQRATASLRRAVRATDIWVQDHHVAVVSGVLGVLLPSVGTLLWTRWDDVVAVAKDLAPVLSVLAVALEVRSAVSALRDVFVDVLLPALETVGDGHQLIVARAAGKLRD